MEKPVGHNNYFYHPKVGDIVIGIIDRRNVDDWLVDIGFSHQAFLPGMAFDGVTKKSAPRFEKGELVVCYIEEVPEAGEVLLSCLQRTQNEHLGRLTGGTLIRMRPSDMNVIDTIGFQELVAAKSALSVAKGENGRFWFDTGNAVSATQLVSLVKTAARQEDPKTYFEEHLIDVKFE